METIYEVQEGEDYIVILDNKEHDHTGNPVATICDRYMADNIVKALELFEALDDWDLTEITIAEALLLLKNRNLKKK